MDASAQPGLTALLLAWYDANRRDLPWRTGRGGRPDPYRVWLSEIMLQQTTVTTVVSYFRDFLARWPCLEDLAVAELDDVLHVWQGLGYYARARNLAACSRVLVDNHGGRFPDTKAGLLALPGIGDYTASAIAAIAFGRREAAVDGNVVRVLSRFYALAEPMPGLRKEIVRRAEPLVPSTRPGDFAEALMDLGATVCVPRAPRCGVCPWREKCTAFGLGNPEAYPVKVKKPEKPTRYGVAFWATDDDGSVLIRKRPEKGLL
ncbi:MAG TPA: A/G-specific adenine glycosylase, partial [Rhodospirillales bacterium]|nr:A/G-specific adenine glycosylase [Rhodospirillales bacterium]